MKKCKPITILDGDAERVMSRVQKLGENECWPWMGRRDMHGYGFITLRGVEHRATRLVCVIHAKPLSEEQCVRHSCDNPCCCNPAHLIPGSQLDNIVDRCVRNRSAQLDRHGRAKLSSRDVKIIKALWEKTSCNQKQLAEVFGVSKSAIAHITCGGTWKKLDLAPA